MVKEEDFDVKWKKAEHFFHAISPKKPDLNGILFLIGVQELGKGVLNFSKEEKQDLMHIAICKILEPSGYYRFEGLDEQGWPHYKSVMPVPFLNLLDQEKFLKIHIIEYLENELNYL